MRFSWVVLSSLLLLSGCSQRGAFDIFKMDDAHERAVEQLRSGTIIQSFETKAIFSALYLNKVDPALYKEGEFFMASVYFEKDDRSDKKRGLESNGYRLTLNGQKVTKIELLGEKDPRRSLMPIQNNWNRYYLIRFDSEQESALALRFENNQTGQVELNYQK